MDITKVNAAIDTALTELNSVTDAAFKTRTTDGLRALTMAAKNLESAQGHLASAVKQSTKPEPAAKA